MTSPALAWLSKTNDYLEKIPQRMEVYFRGLGSSVKKMTQGEVDVICTRAAWYVNVNVERLRQKLLKTLHKQYEDYTKQLGPVSTLINILSNPLGAIGAVASAVKSTINVLTAPYKALIQFALDLVTELARLTENIAKIASYSPTPPSPNIKYDKFKVKVKSISMSDVVKGPDGLPAPEVMYPEPDPIFSRASFQNSFDEARNAYIENKKKYTLSDEEANEIVNVKTEVKDSFYEDPIV